MDEITEAVMGAGASQSGTEFEPATHVVDPVGEFVRWLSIRAKLRYDGDPHRVINYEDISYLAGQIRDDLLGEFDNPAITPLVEKAYSELWPLLPPTQGAVKEQLSSLAYAAVERIHNVLVDMLTKQPEQTCHLKLFCDAAHDCRVSELNLFTLNHDTLLEGFLTKHLDGTIQLTDGFESAETVGIRQWAPHLFDKTSEQGKRRVSLFKLHGSIDWFRFLPSLQNHNKAWLGEFVGRARGSPPRGIVSRGGSEYTRMDGPLVLMGTFNKILDYTRLAVFFEMHYRFVRALDETGALILSKNEPACAKEHTGNEH